MSHTKGKWETGFNGKEGLIFAGHNGYIKILQEIRPELHNGPMTERQMISETNANAKLISKSPEMLEALKGIYRLRNIILPDPLNVKAEHQDEVSAIYNALKTIKNLIEIES